MPISDKYKPGDRIKWTAVWSRTPTISTICKPTDPVGGSNGKYSIKEYTDTNIHDTGNACCGRGIC